jgi:hypothetical protein
MVSDGKGEKKTGQNTAKPVGKKVAKKAAKKKVVAKKVATKKVATKKVVKKAVARQTASAKARVSKAGLHRIGARERYEMIAKMAYFRAEKRNFEPGWEQADWYESEKIVDQMLKQLV